MSGTNPCTMLWMDFGDGDWWIAPIEPGLPFYVNHTWATPGTYTVMAKGFVTCGGEVTTTVTVQSPMPEPTGETPNVLTEVEVGNEDGSRSKDGESVAIEAVATIAEVATLRAPVTVVLDIVPGASGSVTSSPAGFNSTGQDATCTAQFEQSTTVTLTAEPAAGMVFLGWGGACSGTSTCQITASTEQLVTAAFSAGSAATIAYYHADALGSVRVISDASGGIVTRHDYKAFGESSSSLTGDSRRYLGQELDAETGFDHFGARQYRNVWGRFTAADPFVSPASISDPQRWNRYAYSLNRPLSYKDASGLDPIAVSYGWTGADLLPKFGPPIM